MKIAITSVSNSIDSEIDPRFGRAKYFLVYDTETDKYEFVDNTLNVKAMQGAGVQSGQKVSELDVKAVISDHMGPKALSVLKESGIRIFTTDKTKLKDIIEAFKNNELKEISRPDVPGRW